MQLPSSPFPYLAILLFVAIWIVLLKLASFLGGWRDLARVYREQEPFSGKRFRFQSARMRAGTNYNMILFFGTNIYGLHISVLLPFVFGHPALFIPWEDISAEPKRLFWFKMVNLSFEKCPGIPLMISKKFATKLSHASDMKLNIKE
jgi:hypothetical protein